MPLTTLPPLPFILDADGIPCLMFDNSTLSKLNVCPKEFAISWLLKRTASGDKPALNFGGGMHLGLAHRYKALGSQPVTDTAAQEINAIFSEHFEKNPQPVGDHRTLELAQNTMNVYNKTYKKEDFEVVNGPDGLLVESSFMVRLADMEVLINGLLDVVRIYYIGRIDLIVRDSSGLWVLDHKTTSVLGQSLWDDMRMTPQMLGYMWACEQTLGTMPVGYIVNALRVKRPTKKDEYFSDGGITKEDFARMPEYKTAEDVARWKRNTIALIKEMFYHYNEGYFPEKRSWCVGKFGKCQFYEVCSLPERSQASVLSSGMFADNVWSPLNKPTEVAA